MADRRSKLARAVWALVAVFVAVVVVWALSIMGALPLNFRTAATPEELIAIMDSPRDDMRGVKVNGHFLDIGKRRALQIVKGYDQPMFLVRPHRELRIQPRNLTRAELLDFCTNITGKGFDELRSRLLSDEPLPVEWEGEIERRAVRLVKASMFSYFVHGLSDRPVFMSQVELARRLGMDEYRILSQLIPVQERWYEEFTASESLRTAYPVHYVIPMGDELTAWLSERKTM